MDNKLDYKPKQSTQRKIHIIIMVLYFLFHLYVVFHHEHWTDEAQAWVIARNLSIPEMFRILCAEGHPCLWFLFLMPFAKTGLSFYYFSFISLVLMTIAVYLFLETSPFSLIAKTGILFSSIFLYFNPVVCRSYALIALIITILANMYKNRMGKSIMYGFFVSLLFQSHVLVFGLGIGLLLDLIIEYAENTKNKRLLISIGMILFSFAAAILQIMPRSDNPSGIDTSAGGILSRFNIGNLIVNMKYYAYTSWGWQNQNTFYLPYIVLIICVLLIFVFTTTNHSWKKNSRMIMIAICGLGVFFGVVFLVYTPHTQMASIMPMILLFVLWQLYEQNVELNIRTSILAMLSIVSFLTFVVSQSVLREDLKKEYSTSLKTAEVIENAKEGSIVVVENTTYDSAVYSYVISKRKDILFYDARNKTPFVFHLVGSDVKELNTEEIIKEIESGFATKDIYYLANTKKDNSSFKLVYTSANSDSVWKEQYYIYEFRSNAE